MLGAGGFGRKVEAGEPAAAFLEQLKAAGYFDTALAYLDRWERLPGVDPELLSAVELERAQLHFEVAKSAGTPDEFETALSDTETSLRGFVRDRPDHPRAGEARLQLGGLQMIRARRLLDGVGDGAADGDRPDAETRRKAREYLLSAAKTFEVNTESVRERLKSMRGAKVDPGDRDAVARRDQLRAEFLQGLVNVAEAKKMAAETFDEPTSKEAQPLYRDALKRYAELADKYDSYVQGVTANVEIGDIQTALGKTDEAFEAYTNLMDAGDADPLRPARYRAAAGLMRLSRTAQPPRTEEAIATGKPIVDDLRPDERRSPAAVGLQLELARNLIAKANANDTGAGRAAKSDGRRLLTSIVRVPGPHVADAKRLLSDLGVEVRGDAPEAGPAIDGPPPTSVGEAVEQARPLLQAMTTLRAEGGEQASAEAATIAEQIIERLRVGLATVGREDEPDAINNARQFLSFTLLQVGRLHDAAAVGSFLSRVAPGTAEGLTGGTIALDAYRRLLTESDDVPGADGLSRQLATLGQYLASTWPNDPAAAGAKNVLVELALKRSQWDEAERLIAELPAGEIRAKMQRLLGRMVYADGLRADRDGDTDRASRLIGVSRKQLEQGLESIEAASGDEAAMLAALTLAKIRLRQGQPAAALEALDDPGYGAATLRKTLQGIDGSIDADLYATRLRAIVATMADDAGGDRLPEAIETMERLQGAVTGDDASQRLTAIYLSLANDVREQIRQAGPGQKDRLVEAFRVFLDQLRSSTDDPKTLQWIGQTLIGLAEASLPPGVFVAQGPAVKLVGTASETFADLKSRGGDLPASVDYQHARALRYAGKFKDAIDVLEGILKKQPSMLDAQIEAATAYELWAAQVPPKFRGRAYASALGGARKGDDGKNVIWGWGRIGQMTQRSPNFRDQFFDARYHVALSRYLMGKADNDKATIGKAADDITRVAALYPDMGGGETRKRFDALLRKIQADAGRPVTGLSEL